MNNLKGQNSQWWYAGVLIFLALLWTLSMFKGLEYAGGYFGQTYGLLHPSSFPGDLANNFHLASMSIYSILVRLAGELWFDDRFNTVVYFILTLICLLGIDRIAGLFGVKSPGARLAVIAILLVRHMWVDNMPYIMDANSYRPSSYVQPIGVWLAYFVLAGQRKYILMFCVLLVGFSLKNGWHPALASLLLLIRESFPVRWPQIAGVVSGIAVSVLLVYSLWANATGKVAENVWLFNESLMVTENSETNPFMDGLGPVVFALFMIGAFLILRVSNLVQKKQLQAVCVISFIIYFVAGIYYKFSPDSIKIPYLVALGVSRSTWWTQMLMLIALSSYAVQSLLDSAPKRKIQMALFLVFLYLFPFVDYESLRLFFINGRLYFTPAIFYKIAMVGLCFLSALAFFYMGRLLKKISPLKWQVQNVWPVFLLGALIVCSTTIYAYKTYQHIPALKFLAQNGIMGGTPGAQWVGINEFFRDQTDKRSTILALTRIQPLSGYDYGHWQPQGIPLAVDTSLRIRTGRSMPIASHEIAFYFDYDKRIEYGRRYKWGWEFAEAWFHCDMDKVRRSLFLLDDPDYLVIPSAYLCGIQQINYTIVKTHGGFTILRKNALDEKLAEGLQ